MTRSPSPPTPTGDGRSGLEAKLKVPGCFITQASWTRSRAVGSPESCCRNCQGTLKRAVTIPNATALFYGYHNTRNSIFSSSPRLWRFSTDSTLSQAAVVSLWEHRMASRQRDGSMGSTPFFFTHRRGCVGFGKRIESILQMRLLQAT